MLKPAGTVPDGGDSRLPAPFWGILALAMALRLYGATLPLLDSHQLRQAQTAMMARNLFYDGMNIFRTRLDFFGIENRAVIMEFPLMHALSALLYHAFGVHDVIGRLVSVAFSFAAIIAMYGLSRRFLSREGALWAAGLYAFSPMNIFFSRAFMPESSMMAFCVAAVYFSLRWLERPSFARYAGALVCAMLAALVKPTGGIILAPIAAAWYARDGGRMLRRIEFWAFLAATVIPMLSWGVYAGYVNSLNPDLPPAFGGWVEIIFGRGGMIAHWFDPAFYRFLGGSIVLLLLTPLGFAAAAAGCVVLPSGRPRTVLFFWLAAVIAYFFALSGANSGHVYYQLHLLPVAAILSGYAAEKLEFGRRFGRVIVAPGLRRRALVASVLLAHGAGYAWFFGYMYANRMPYTLECARVIRERFPGRPALAAYEPAIATPVVLSYYAHSSAWRFRLDSDAQAVTELERLRRLGATAYVALETAYGNGVSETQRHGEFWRHLNRNYRPVALTAHYLIYDLRS